MQETLSHFSQFKLFICELVTLSVMNTLLSFFLYCVAFSAAQNNSVEDNLIVFLGNGMKEFVKLYMSCPFEAPDIWITSSPAYNYQASFRNVTVSGLHLYSSLKVEEIQQLDNSIRIIFDYENLPMTIQGELQLSFEKTMLSTNFKIVPNFNGYGTQLNYRVSLPNIIQLFDVGSGYPLNVPISFHLDQGEAQLSPDLLNDLGKSFTTELMSAMWTYHYHDKFSPFLNCLLRTNTVSDLLNNMTSLVANHNCTAPGLELCHNLNSDPEAIDCLSLPDGYYPDSESCEKYFGCLNGKLLVRTCPFPLLFDSIMLTCIQPSVAKCAFTPGR